MLKGLDLTHELKVQRPMLIMKCKFNHALKSPPLASIPMRKGTTVLSNEAYFHQWLPRLCPPRDAKIATGCGKSASTHASQDSGELRSSTKRGSSSPHSTPGVVPSIPTCI